MALLANVAAGDNIDPSWGNAVRNQSVQVTTSGARPGAPTEGMTIYETDTDKVMTYDGSGWREATSVGAWTPYTPTVKFGATAATIANASRYHRAGRLVTVDLAVRLTNLNAGTGALTITRPVVGRFDATVTHEYVLALGVAHAFDVSVGQIYAGSFSSSAVDQSDVSVRTLASPQVAWSNTVPFTMAVGALNTGDEITGRFSYEAAA